MWEENYMRATLMPMLVGALAIGAFATPALAAHGKVGLWKITVTMQNAAVGEIPEADRKRMEAMGIHPMGGNTVLADHCMTEAEVNNDTLSANSARQQGCEMENTTVSGQTFTGEMVCKGQMTGTGHMRVTYDSPEHYSGSMQFTGTAHGQPVSMTNSYEGRWIKADCGGVTH